MDTTKQLPTVISFCSGYGGIERGLNLAGFEHRVIAYVEIEAFCCENLATKMENEQLDAAPIWTNLKTFPAHLFRDKVGLITGGYPCQGFSAAGQRKGAEDPRHLWPYIKQHITTIRPVRVFFENVEGHITLGLREVVGDLESLGYTTTWGIFSAREVGAPHQRKRVYIMGDSKSRRLSRWTKDSQREGSEDICERSDQNLRSKSERSSQTLADAFDKRSQGRLSGREDTKRKAKFRHFRCSSSTLQREQDKSWPPEPRLGRVVDGTADRVDRIRALGNGVVPQTAAKAWQILGDKL